MANKQGFDLASVLGSVSKLGTEQIVLLPLDLIDPDPENFYSLEGLDELAGNIELMGLLDPLRVRPNGERYTVVSGHRRRAAIMLIRDGGSKQFADGVPCIVEYGEASDAMRKLRLIYANASTRQLNSADLSRQAEEVTRLLYELQEQGVKFPGRMRDHVAQACGVTKSKIARLHAIRENLEPELLRYYDDGQLVEDAAYQLSRMPKETQETLSDKLADGRQRKMPTGPVIDCVLSNLEGLQKPFPCRAHAGQPACHNLQQRIVRSLLQPYTWAICDSGKCCMDCFRAKEGCSGACREARDRANVEKAAEEEKKAERERDAEISQQRLKDRIRKRAATLLPYAEAAGLQDKEKIFDSYQAATVAQLRKWAAGDMENEHFYADNSVNPGMVREATSMVKHLGCSLELAMGLPEKKAAKAEPAAARGWETGTPKAAGWYAARTTLHGKPMRSPRCLWWNGSGWMLSAEEPYHIDKAMQVAGWIPLPEEAEA